MKFFQLIPLLLMSLFLLGHSPKGGSASKIRCLEKHKRDCCKWKGVQCHNRTNHVILLDLHNPIDDDIDDISYAPLKGMISASLLELQHLKYLDLSYNDFGHAPIPDFIGSLSELRYLNLAIANFSGPIPDHLGNLSSKSLDWVSHLHSLEYLDFSFTNLSKATNWLQAISKLTSIKELHMYVSALPNIPPSSLPSINASVPLATLDLRWNLFEVSTLALIRWFSNFSSTGLTSIDLDYNSMPSGIPAYFGNMSSLTDLDLCWNNLTGEYFRLIRNLSGPTEKTLQFLTLCGNSISGSMPNLSSFSSLESLNLWANQLNGSIQEGYLKLAHLIYLDLSSNNLRGPLPDLSFSLSLEELFLQNNSFNGTLDDSIGCLHKRETLWIGSNLFAGIITESILSNLSRLQKLDFSLNPFLTLKFSPEWVPPFQLKYLSLRHWKLEPNFPFDFSPAVLRVPKGLDLSRNKISGSITFLCHARHWESLDLSNNVLSDQIPDCFTHFERLKYLNLANNNFFGKIPHSFGSLGALPLLHLCNNSFSGELPTSMRNCTNLKMIDLGENRLTGYIPTWIGDKFSQLKVLVLRFNEFNGSIPPSWCGQNIQILDLSCNKISGVIPDCVHKYVAMIAAGVENGSFIIDQDASPYWVYDPIDQDAFQNQFKSLENAYFMWKGNRSLNFLNFSRNHLSGSIPTSLGELTYPGILNLSYNLCGKIPTITQLLTFNESSYMGNPGLCGLPLNKSCPEDESHQDLNNNATSSEKNEDDGFINEGFYISLGLGFIVGF
ncbi:Leucine-rich repeat protein [Handroanthus impetiginosus]|uniref:Leucine-rich repeat protein n=1 Tax=Handroanthus impetiginosus TaxID=429701 RepID=A0A2G9HW93_9LAMI|nr:Leucine-rich repeat protein [Handroanthus impetiginosus]